MIQQFYYTILLAFLFSFCSHVLVAQSDELVQEGIIYSQPLSDTPDGALRFTGLIRSQQTHEPISRARVQLMNGSHILTAGLADEEGRFVLQVPMSDHALDSLGLLIQYLNHSFLQEELKPHSQDLVIELNDEIWLDEIVIVPTSASPKHLGPICQYPFQPYSTRIVYTKAPRLPKYDDIKEWIWLNHSDVFSDAF